MGAVFTIERDAAQAVDAELVLFVGKQLDRQRLFVQPGKFAAAKRLDSGKHDGRLGAADAALAEQIKDGLAIPPNHRGSPLGPQSVVLPADTS